MSDRVISNIDHSPAPAVIYASFLVTALAGLLVNHYEVHDFTLGIEVVELQCNMETGLPYLETNCYLHLYVLVLLTYSLASGTQPSW